MNHAEKRLPYRLPGDNLRGNCRGLVMIEECIAKLQKELDTFEDYDRRAMEILKKNTELSFFTRNRKAIKESISFLEDNKKFKLWSELLKSCIEIVSDMRTLLWDNKNTIDKQKKYILEMEQECAVKDAHIVKIEENCVAKDVRIAELEQELSLFRKAEQQESLSPKARKSYLMVIAALCNKSQRLSIDDTSAVSLIQAEIEKIGLTLGDDTIRKIIKEVQSIKE